MATMWSNPRSTPSPKSFPMSVNCISWLEIQTVAYSFQVLFKNIPSQMILHLKLLIDPRSVLTTGHPKLVWMALVLFSVISDKREVTRITQGWVLADSVCFLVLSSLLTKFVLKILWSLGPRSELIFHTDLVLFLCIWVVSKGMVWTTNTKIRIKHLCSSSAKPTHYCAIVFADLLFALFWFKSCQ